MSFLLFRIRPAIQPGSGAAQCHLLAVSRMAGRMWKGRDGWMGGRGWEARLSVDKHTNSSLVKGSSRGLVIRDESWVRNKGRPTGYRTAA